MTERENFTLSKKYNNVNKKFKELCKLKDLSRSSVVWQLIAKWVEDNRTDKLDTFMEAKPIVTLDTLPRIHEQYDSRILNDLDTNILAQIHENTLHTKWAVEKIMDGRNRAREDKLHA